LDRRQSGQRSCQKTPRFSAVGAEPGPEVVWEGEAELVSDVRAEPGSEVSALVLALALGTAMAQVSAAALAESEAERRPASRSTPGPPR
jgi:hypothetical protein